jgi:FkbM family methyltransferase
MIEILQTPLTIAGRKGRWFQFNRDRQSFSFWIDERPDSIQDMIVRTGDFYEAGALELIRELLPPAARIVDVGANIGNHAVYFDRVCRADKVFVIEPNPDIIEDLIANTAANDCRGVDLSLTGFAVGAEAGSGTLFISPSDDAIRNRGGITVVRENDAACHTIPIKRLDDLDLGDIDFIKIDVEGNSVGVLTGASSLLKRCRPSIFVEVDVPDLPSFTAWLNENGYDVSAAVEYHPGILNFLLIARDDPAIDASDGASARLVRRNAEATGKHWSDLQAEKRRADRSEDTLAITIATLRNSDARAAQAEARALASENAAQSARDALRQAEARAQASENAAQSARDALRQAEARAQASENAAQSARDALRQAEARARGSENAAQSARDALRQAEARARASENAAQSARDPLRQAEARAQASDQKEMLYLKEIAEFGRQAAQSYSDNTRRPLRTIRRIIYLKAIKRGMKLGIVSKERKLGNWFDRHRPDRFINRIYERDASHGLSG